MFLIFTLDRKIHRILEFQNYVESPLSARRIWRDQAINMALEVVEKPKKKQKVSSEHNLTTEVPRNAIKRIMKIDDDCKQVDIVPFNNLQRMSCR